MVAVRSQQKKYGTSPLDGRGNGEEKGVAALWAGLTGGLSDLGRGIGNTASDIGDFFASRPSTTKAGSQVFGPDRGAKPGAGNPNGELIRMNNRANADRLRQQQSSAAQLEEPKSILDFLAQAQGLLGGGSAGGGVNYDPLRAAARGRFTEGDAKLEAMYRQLANSIGGQASSIGQNYDTGAAALNQNAAQGQNTIEAAYDSARDAQTRQLQQLGIQDAAAVTASRGTDAAGDQAAALSGIEQNRAANVGANEAARQSGLAQNASSVSAAGLAGAEQRGRLSAELNQLLAEYDVAEQGQNAQLQSRAQDPSQALSIAQLLQEDYNGRLPQEPSFDQQIDLEKLALQRLKQQGIPEDRFSDWAKLVLGAK